MGLFSKGIPAGTERIYAEMKRDLHLLISLIEKGEVATADAIYCTACRVFHPHHRRLLKQQEASRRRALDTPDEQLLPEQPSHA